MEFSSETRPEEQKNQFPMSVCPKCSEVQGYPILDNNVKTKNLKCPKCNSRFCSYCGGDTHYIVPCHKPLPQKKSFSGDQRV